VTPVAVASVVAVVGGAHLAAYFSGHRAVAGVLKALPILFLAGDVLGVPDPVGGRSYAVLIAVGLLFSAVGDVCLVWPERFVPGLASFLVAHLLYVAAFTVGAGPGGLAWSWIVGLALFTMGFLRFLWPHLGRMRGPVAGYVAVIATMAWAAARRAGAPGVTEPSGTLALAGALLFLGSDGILATNRFVVRFASAHAWVMLTYYAAQTLIALSVR
jgi:uncharacterized membrane protein YhhN